VPLKKVQEKVPLKKELQKKREKNHPAAEVVADRPLADLHRADHLPVDLLLADLLAAGHPAIPDLLQHLIPPLMLNLLPLKPIRVIAPVVVVVVAVETEVCKIPKCKIHNVKRVPEKEPFLHCEFYIYNFLRLISPPAYNSVLPV